MVKRSNEIIIIVLNFVRMIIFSFCIINAMRLFVRNVCCLQANGEFELAMQISQIGANISENVLAVSPSIV